MAKNNLPAEKYAQPHPPEEVNAAWKSNGYKGDNHENGNGVEMTVANVRNKPYSEPKTNGIKIRGTGAATKGTMARGPMA